MHVLVSKSGAKLQLDYQYTVFDDKTGNSEVIAAAQIAF